MQKVEIFNSINEFMCAINTRPENESYRGKSLASNDGDFEYAGTNNLYEADVLFRGGWLEGRKYLEALKTSGKAFAPAPVYKRERRVAGGRIHIGSLIAGSDKVFNKRIKTFRDSASPVINVFYCVGVVYDTDKFEIAESAGRMFSAIRNLEAEGYKVELYIGQAMKLNKNCYSNIIRLKSSCEPLSETKMLYPIVHPSFLRRHCLRWTETSPIIKDYSAGYGVPISNSKELYSIVNTSGKKIHACIAAQEAINNKYSVEQLMESIKKQRAEAVKK